MCLLVHLPRALLGRSLGINVPLRTNIKGLLVTFAILREAAVSFVMSILLSVRTEQSASTGGIFLNLDI